MYICPEHNKKQSNRQNTGNICSMNPMKQSVNKMTEKFYFHSFMNDSVHHEIRGSMQNHEDPPPGSSKPVTWMPPPKNEGNENFLKTLECYNIINYKPCTY